MKFYIRKYKNEYNHFFLKVSIGRFWQPCFLSLVINIYLTYNTDNFIVRVRTTNNVILKYFNNECEWAYIDPAVVFKYHL